MSDEQLPPTHQPWGARPEPEPQPPYAPPPPNPYVRQDPYGGAPPPNPYGAQPYAPPYAPAAGGGGVPDHPSATASLVLGIVSLVGVVLCGGLTLLLAPFAWGVGSRALRAIDASPGQFGGREKASAGRIMGIIGTVLLVLGILALVALFALLFAVGQSGDPTPSFPSESAFVNS
jgi:hypothetical protein